MPQASRPGSVLFACGQNVIRSPIAAALARRLYPTMYTRSAGVIEGNEDGFVLSVMKEVGIDINGHIPHTFEDLADGNFDLIITLAPEADDKAREFTKALATDVEYWETFDPSHTNGSREQRLEAYRNLRDSLEERIKQRFGAP